MGSGKTTLGKRLAEKLKWQFIDLDAFIENRYRKTIAEIFAEKGENRFREVEKRVLHEVAQFENVVISTGGGAPCFFNNLAFMNKWGTTIYLKASIEALTKRLNTTKEKRPLIKDKKPEELKTFISGNLKKRELFYNQATYVYEAKQLDDLKNIETTVDHLIQYLSEKKLNYENNCYS
jgi:shikimate kinase